MKIVQWLQLAALALAVACPTAAGATPSSLFTDGRMKAWSADALAGRHERIVASIEKDQRGPEPHPFGPWLWWKSHVVIGDVATVLARTNVDPALARLVASARTFQADADADPDSVIAREPEILERNDPIELDELIDAHEDLGTGRAPDLALLFAERWPNVFLSAYVIYKLPLRTAAGAPDPAAPLVALAHGSLRQTPVGAFLSVVLERRSVESVDLIDAIDAALAISPDDPWALALRALHLSRLYRHDEALADQQRAHHLMPLRFISSGATFAMYLGRFEEGRALAERAARANRPRTPKDLSRGLAIFEAFTDGGEQGLALQEIDGLLARFPDEPAVLIKAIGSARFHGQSARVDDLTRRLLAVAAGGPRTVEEDAIRLRIEALVAERNPAAALELFEAKRREGRVRLNVDWIDDALVTLERHGERIEGIERLLREQPAQRWRQSRLAAAYAAAERYDEAIAMMRAFLAKQPDSQWEIERLLEWLEKQSGRPAADDELVKLRERFPWAAALWRVAVARVADAKVRASLWREAVNANPGAEWANLELIYLLNERERYPDALEVARAYRQVAGPGDAHLNAVLHFVFVVEQWSKRAVLEPGLLAEARQGVQELDAVNHYLGARYAAQLAQATGDKAAMAAAFCRWQEVAPDEVSGIFGIARMQDPPAAAKACRVRALRRYLDRAPFEAGRLNEFLNQVTQWEGGPVLALRAIQRVRDAGVSYDAGGWLSRAYGSLGEHQRRWLLSYARGQHIANSGRYVGWFEEARANAGKPATRVVVPFDRTTWGECGLRTPSGKSPVELARSWVDPGSENWVLVCHPDGSTVLIEEHPLSGKTTLLREGAAWVRAEYDLDGTRFIGFTDATGRTMKLVYDDQQRIAEIVEPRTRLSFSYDAHDRPTVIRLDGVGRIETRYAPDGAIAETGSFDDDGKAGGSGVALRVTSAFQRLLEGIRVFGDPRGAIPDLPFDDLRGEKLRREAYGHGGQDAPGAPPKAAARLRLAAYLIDNLGVTRRYQQEARDILDDIIAAGRGASATARQREDAYAALTLEAKRLRATRPLGLLGEELAWVEAARAWASLSTSVAAKRAVLAIDQAGFVPYAAESWMERSALQNQGLWRFDNVVDVVGRDSPGEKIVAGAFSPAGPIAAVSARRIHVLRRGFWEHFGIDKKGLWSASTSHDDAARLDASVAAFAADGALWLGGGSGLMRVASTFEGAPDRFRETGSQRTAAVGSTLVPGGGLPSPRVTALVPFGDGVLVGTAAGLARCSSEGCARVGSLAPAEVIALDVRGRDALVVDEHGVHLLRGSADGSFSFGKATTLQRAAAKRALFFGADQVVTWVGDGLFTTFVPRDAHGAAVGGATPRPLPRQGDVKKSKLILDVAVVSVEGEDALAVLTDVDATLLKRGRFQALGLDRLVHLDTPAAVERALTWRAAGDAADGGEGFALVTASGVASWEPARARVVQRSRVRDLLTLPELGLTFVASDDGLFAVAHDDAGATPIPVDYIGAEHLARDDRGGFVVSDGTTVLRYDAKTGRATELFAAAQASAPENTRRSIADLLVARDGAVWAIAGASAYRFVEGKPLEEWSIYKDPAAFPSRSEWLWKIVETIEGKIWIVASDESHLQHRGMRLEGGLLELRGNTWVRLQKEKTPWFITGYTPLDARHAIVGTSEGFAEHRHGRLTTFAGLADATYLALRDGRDGKNDHPSLFLGTRGARVGDLWLFGSAAGVVAYLDGQWLYPDRLNWMLPRQELAPYGARVVHAVETDPRGRVYVGTDHGLLVYDGGGPTAASFLVSGSGPTLEAGLQAAAQRQLRDEASALEGAVLKESGLRERIQRAQRAKDALLGAEQLAAVARSRARPLDPEAAPMSERESDLQAVDEQLERRVRELKKEYIGALQDLEQNDPALMQMFDLKPLDLFRVRDRLLADDVVVQLLPGESTLAINVVKRDGFVIRRVEVSRVELQRRAAEVARRVRAGPGHARTLEPEMFPDEIGPIDDELAWLYDQCFRPIEDLLVGAQRVFVIPAGTLHYVPWAALVRTRSGNGKRPEYAIDRYHLAMTPSLHNVLLSKPASSTTTAVVLGDPDETLPHAREEAAVVASALGARAHVGSEATSDLLWKDARSAGIVHLATHGVLDSADPKRSYLLLANRERFTTTDAFALQLPKAKLVVLSACETGIGVGANGLEYAMIARGFRNAGASSVIATLWPVNDEATSLLMKKLYAKTDADPIVALTEAQRTLADDPKWSAPYYWAGFELFGIP